MFVGHYGVAFGLRSDRNRVPLWVLFVAVQLLDYIWVGLILLGVEKLRVIGGFMRGSMLDAYYMPYSHSLPAAIGWSVLAAALYKFARRAKASVSALVVIGFAVFSHWLLDAVAHPPNLAIYDDKWKIGLALWNYPVLEFAIEIALIAGGVLLYLRRNPLSFGRRVAALLFAVGLIIVEWGDMFVPRAPLSDRMTAAGVFVFYTLFVVIALLIELRTNIART
jgi:membrane-bound metal-dependent hydrolase YbcI (DUF457 family)